MTKRTILYLAMALILMVACFGLGWYLRKPVTKERIVVHTDTLTVYDTIHHDRPVYVSRRIIDSIFVPLRDTIRLHDTAYVILPRTQKEYTDSLYHAWVSGYEPDLDSIEVYIRTRYVTTTIQAPEKKWHAGVSAGYGATLQGNVVRLSPYVGVGVTYSIIGW